MAGISVHSVLRWACVRRLPRRWLCLVIYSSTLRTDLSICFLYDRWVSRSFRACSQVACRDLARAKQTPEALRSSRTIVSRGAIAGRPKEEAARSDGGLSPQRLVAGGSAPLFDICGNHDCSLHSTGKYSSTCQKLSPFDKK